MVTAADSYSRFVTWMKVLLPLGALALLSTIFMFAGEIDPSKSIPYAELNVAEIAREQRMSAPYFSGVTEDGAVIAISASVARPAADGANSLIVERLEAQFDTSAGVHISLTAKRGIIDNDAQLARLQGGAIISTSDGYRIQTDAVTTLLDQTDIRTDGPVQAVSPLGDLNAGLMEITQDDATGAQHLVFKDGVKLVYQRKSN